MEVLLRTHGHQPSVSDNLELWANVRDTVYDSDGKVIVLLGASRMQLGINTNVLRKRFPDYTIAQLAVNGRRPMRALEDLANDKKFKGIVVCSVMTMSLPQDRWEGQEKQVKYYHQRTNISNKINQQIITYTQNHFVIANPNIKLTNMIKEAVKDFSMIKPSYVQGQPDRSSRANFSHRTDEQLLQYVPGFLRSKKQSNHPLQTDPKQWLEDVQIVETLVQKIQLRGGQVVFVRMPTSGELWDYEEQSIPKSLFWDRFAEKSSAETIHFKEIETLKNFTCPDRSHLDYRDTPQFTNALFDEIARRKVFSTTSFIQTANKMKPSIIQ
ncbi:hypothetical protein MNBD_PLANCTO02-839 [hydrothermal vent metagenome]|uniref:Uncharacterized protein n=1 Tax=hydrothermal vent metagenome TaxID=652676 RepID=A0A3B1E4E4_9ZZZZ